MAADPCAGEEEGAGGGWAPHRAAFGLVGACSFHGNGRRPVRDGSVAVGDREVRSSAENGGRLRSWGVRSARASLVLGGAAGGEARGGDGQPGPGASGAGRSVAQSGLPGRTECRERRPETAWARGCGSGMSGERGRARAVGLAGGRARVSTGGERGWRGAEAGPGGHARRRAGPSWDGPAPAGQSAAAALGPDWPPHLEDGGPRPSRGPLPGSREAPRPVQSGCPDRFLSHRP